MVSIFLLGAFATSARAEAPLPPNPEPDARGRLVVPEGYGGRSSLDVSESPPEPTWRDEQVARRIKRSWRAERAPRVARAGGFYGLTAEGRS